jgi:hypothetical protein
MIDSRNSRRILTYGIPSYCLLALAYILLVFLLPVSPETIHKYNLTTGNYHVLLLLVSLPLLFVWFAAFLSWSMLSSYADSLKSSRESDNFRSLASGCGWLAWSMPVAGIVGLVLNAIAYKSPGFHPAAVILTNYAGLILPLVAFTIINNAARGLFTSAKLNYRLNSSRALAFFFVCLGVVYCFLTFRHFNLASLGSSDNPYFLPIWLMVLTVTIPYLYAWFVGILAAYEINLYSKAIKGVFYRQALRLLVVGLIMVIASLIALQYINNVLPHSGYFILDYKLVTVVIFRILTGIGFGLMALGALRLRKIEEI